MPDRRSLRRFLRILPPLFFLACGDDVSAPPGEDEETTFDLPAEVAGVTLERSSYNGSEFADTTALWQESLDALGVTASELSMSVARAPEGSAMSLQIVSLTADGVDWAGRVTALAETLRENGMVAERRNIGGHQTWRLHLPGASSKAYYHAVGGVLFTIWTDDEDIAEEVLAPLPSSAGDGSEEGVYQPPRGIAVFVRVLNPPRPPVCVAQEFGGPTVTFMTLLASTVGVLPDPHITLLASSEQGNFEPAISHGMTHTLRYAVTRYGFGSVDRVTAQALHYSGGGGFVYDQFEVQQCMNGTWWDGPRILRIRHVFDAVEATIESGALECGAAGVAFSGTLPTRLPIASMSGTDMKVCNPTECVEAGLLDLTALVPYTMTLNDAGTTADFEWEETLFDYEYDDEGTLVGCTPNGTGSQSFSIHRRTFGPEQPY